MLGVCMSEELDFAWDIALRGLATICCVPDSIAELEKVFNLGFSCRNLYF